MVGEDDDVEAVQAIVLGLVQGFTEFLPVSSSGHLAIMREILGVETGVLTFEVAVHLGTLLAVLLVFRKMIARLVVAGERLLGDFIAGKGLSNLPGDPDRRLVWNLIIGTVPAAVIGLALEGLVEKAFGSVLSVGIMLIVTGFVLLTSSRVAREEGKPLSRLGTAGAFAIGVAQAVAVFPGISRSGSTISAGLALGLARDDAATFSFLLSIPAILGATVLKAFDLLSSPAFRSQASYYAMGLVAAFVSGYLAIHLVYGALKSRRFSGFAYYCFAVGAAVIIWQAFVI